MVYWSCSLQFIKNKWWPNTEPNPYLMFYFLLFKTFLDERNVTQPAHVGFYQSCCKDQLRPAWIGLLCKLVQVWCWWTIITMLFTIKTYWWSQVLSVLRSWLRWLRSLVGMPASKTRHMWVFLAEIIKSFFFYLNLSNILQISIKLNTFLNGVR